MPIRRGIDLLYISVFLSILSLKSALAVYNEDCVKFLSSEPHAIDADFAYDGKIRFTTWVADYQLDHKINLKELGPVAEDNDTTSLCVGFQTTTSQTKENGDDGSDSSVAWVTMETSPDVATAVVNVSSECWARDRQMAICDPIFLPMPQIIDSAMLAHSPVTEKFWTLLDDKNFKDNWIQKLTFGSIKKKFPAEWVSNIKLGGLKFLKIKGNDWGRPQTLLSSLPNLERLDLTLNNIQELPKETFKNTPKLRDILLAKNNLSVFPAYLDQLPSLSLLDITNPEGRAKLVISKEDVLTLKKVQIMGLENINLSANISALLDLPRLSFLNLSGCGIDEIDDIPSLTQRKPLVLVDLSKNNLKNLPPKLFSSLGNIRTLLLERNAIESCPAFIENLPQLSRLDLSHNKISRLTVLCFDKPHNSLENLDLSHNQISNIMKGVFRTLNALRILNLSNNKLSTIQPPIFEGVLHLRILDLSSNLLTSELYFNNIEIVDLNLSNNSISSFANISDSETKIERLDISRNNITQLSERPPPARYLNISYNGITKLSKDNTESFNLHVEVVDLGGNPFNCCDSDLQVLQAWLKESSVDIQNLGTKHALKCLIPGENQKYPVRTFVDEEGLCHSTNSSRNCLSAKDNSALYGSIGFLSVLVCILSIALGFVLYKQRQNVLTWLRF